MPWHLDLIKEYQWSLLCALGQTAHQWSQGQLRKFCFKFLLIVPLATSVPNQLSRELRFIPISIKSPSHVYRTRNRMDGTAFGSVGVKK